MKRVLARRLTRTHELVAFRRILPDTGHTVEIILGQGIRSRTHIKRIRNVLDVFEPFFEFIRLTIQRRKQHLATFFDLAARKIGFAQFIKQRQRTCTGLSGRLAEDLLKFGKSGIRSGLLCRSRRIGRHRTFVDRHYGTGNGQHRRHGDEKFDALATALLRNFGGIISKPAFLVTAVFLRGDLRNLRSLGNFLHNPLFQLDIHRRFRTHGLFGLPLVIHKTVCGRHARKIAVLRHLGGIDHRRNLEFCRHHLIARRAVRQIATSAFHALHFDARHRHDIAAFKLRGTRLVLAFADALMRLGAFVGFAFLRLTGTFFLKRAFGRFGLSQRLRFGTLC